MESTKSNFYHILNGSDNLHQPKFEIMIGYTPHKKAYRLMDLGTVPSSMADMSALTNCPGTHFQLTPAVSGRTCSLPLIGQQHRTISSRPITKMMTMSTPV